KAKKLLEDQMRYFHDATRCMFANIYEIDITNDCFVRDSKLHQFVQISDLKNLTYTESLKMLAQKAIKSEYRENFINIFSCNNILIEFKKDVDHISFDCPVLVGDTYQWLKYDAHIFAVNSDNSIHIYLYCKNINSEVKIIEEARIDNLTKCLTRGAIEQDINELLGKNKDRKYAFFIIDIDNFKRANDTFGHGFGDFCLQKFSEGIRKEFRSDDIIGRIGGDEFVVFLPYPDKAWARKKAEKLVHTLDMHCQQNSAQLHISASVGVAFYPEDGCDMPTLYHNADAALYAVKGSGKNNFQFYAEAAVCSLNNADYVVEQGQSDKNREISLSASQTTSQD
ncbi:MAG: GGDEF domain-containing protein, partial [Desulfovibrio sp.]|nr:GGDEF domain-containing protein [Desulfovibrio sp.]